MADEQDFGAALADSWAGAMTSPETLAQAGHLVAPSGQVVGGDKGAAEYAKWAGDQYEQTLDAYDHGDKDKRAELRKHFEERVRQGARNWQLERATAYHEGAGQPSTDPEHYFSRMIPGYGAGKDIAYYKNLKDAADAVNSGTATYGHYDQLGHYLAMEKANAQRGFVRQTADALAGVVPAAAEWAMSGGLAPAAEQGAKLAARKALGSLAEGVAGKAVGALAQSAVRTLPTQAAHYFQERAPKEMEQTQAGPQLTGGEAAPAALYHATIGTTLENAPFAYLGGLAPHGQSILKGAFNVLAAGEIGQDVAHIAQTAPQGGPAWRLAFGTPEERAAALKDIGSSGIVATVLETAMHATRQQQARGQRVDSEAMNKAVAEEIVKAQAQEESTHAGNAPPEAGTQPAPDVQQAPGVQEQGHQNLQAGEVARPEAAPAQQSAQPVPGAEGDAGSADGAAAAGPGPQAPGQPDAAGATGLPPGGEPVLSDDRIEELRHMLGAIGEKTGRMSDARVLERAKELKLDQFSSQPAEGMGAASPGAAPGQAPQGAPGAEAPVVPERTLATPPTNAFQAAKDWVKSFAQHSYPSLTRLSPASGEKLAQASNAPTAAHDAWNYFGRILKVNGKPLADLSPEEARLVGSVWQERRMREYRDKLNAAGRADEANEVATLVGQPGSPLQTEADYQQGQQALWSFWQAVQQEWTPTVEKNYRGLKGLEPGDAIDSLSQIPGLPLNAIAIPEGESMPGAVTTSRQGMGNLRIRKPGFMQQAELNAPAYDVDVRHMMQRTLDLGLPAARRAEFLRTALDEGTVKAVGGTEPPPDKSYDAISNGRFVVDTAKHPEPPRGWHYAADPQTLPKDFAFLERDKAKPPEGWKYLGLDPAKGLAGIDPNSRYYAHPDAYTEIVQGLGIGERPGEVLKGAASFLGKLNATALVSPVEFATHVANQLTAAFRPGMGVPGLNVLTDTIPNMWRIWTGDPETLRKIWDLSTISASFHHEARLGKIPVLNRVQQFTTGMIDLMQKAVRLQLADAYDKMVAQGAFAGGETGKRDFINQAVGNYNARASNRITQFLKDAGLQPFATAASTFTVQGIKSAYTGAVNAESAPGKLVQNHAIALAKLLPVLAIAPVANMLRWGQAFPQNTPAFAVKTREDDDGKVHYLDPLAFTGQRRGWRATGARAVAEGMIDNKTGGEIADRAVRDVLTSGEHLVAGPAVQFVHTALTGEDALGRKVATPVTTAKTEAGQEKARSKGLAAAQSSVSWQNLKAALLNINGIVSAVTDADRPATPRTVAEKVFHTLGPFGERERTPDMLAKINMDLSRDPKAQAERDHWLAEVVTKAIGGDQQARQLVADAKIPTAHQLELFRKLRLEHDLERRGLTAAAAQARVWGAPSDPNERKTRTPRLRQLVPTGD